MIFLGGRGFYSRVCACPHYLAEVVAAYPIWVSRPRAPQQNGVRPLVVLVITLRRGPTDRIRQTSHTLTRYPAQEASALLGKLAPRYLLSLLSPERVNV